MKISIITVAFNSSTTIEGTINSIAQQSYHDIEFIVIDGCSKDNTLEIVKSFGGIVNKLISECDSGIYFAMNKGLSLATGEVVGFLNSDDVFKDSNVIADVAKAMADPSVDACYGDLVYVGKNDANKIIRYWKSKDYKRGLCTLGWMPAHPTLYIRRVVYIKYGNYDTSFHLQADYEMSLRLLEVKNIKTTYIPKIMVKMRIGGASNSSLKNIILGNIEACKACQKHGIKAGIVFVIRKIFSRIPQFFWRP